jgi:hypothetical protein
MGHYRALKHPGRQGRPPKASEVADGTLRVYWSPDLTQYIRNTREGSEVGFDYVPPPTWPVQYHPVIAPRIVLVSHMFLPNSARSVAWESYLATLTTELEEEDNFYVNGAGFSSTGFSFAELMPRSEDIDSTDKFLGLDILHVVLYQDLGATIFQNIDDNDIPFFTPQADHFGLNAYTAPSSTIRSLFSYADDNLAAYDTDKDYFQRAFPHFVRQKTFLYYDQAEPLGTRDGSSTEANEVFPVGYTEAIRNGNITRPGFAAPMPKYDQTIYLNGPFLEWIPNPTDKMADYPSLGEGVLARILVPPDVPETSCLVKTYIDQWSDLDSSQPAYLQSLADDLQDYGVEYKGTVDYQTAASSSIQADIEAHFDL